MRYEKLRASGWFSWLSERLSISAQVWISGSRTQAPPSGPVQGVEPTLKNYQKCNQNYFLSSGTISINSKLDIWVEIFPFSCHTHY